VNVAALGVLRNRLHESPPLARRICWLSFDFWFEP